MSALKMEYHIISYVLHHSCVLFWPLGHFICHLLFAWWSWCLCTRDSGLCEYRVLFTMKYDSEFLGSVGFVANNFWVCVAIQWEGNWSRLLAVTFVEENRLLSPGCFNQFSLFKSFPKRERMARSIMQRQTRDSNGSVHCANIAYLKHF